MSTNTFHPSPVNVIRPWPVRVQAEESCGISVSRSVKADRARIFQAITVPEYMEAWFSAPGSIPGYTRVFGCDGSFSICGTTENGSQFKIRCTYAVYRRSKLVFSWKLDSFPGTSLSTVRIRLQGDFERTTVDVTHSELRGFERQWCEALWEGSLEKLSRLF